MLLQWLQLPWPMLVLLSRPRGLIRAFPPSQAVLPALGNGGTEGGWFSHSRGVPVNSSGIFSSWFLQLQVFNQPSKEVLQGNLTKASAGFSSDCSLCVLCLSSARHAVAFRQGTGLVKGKVSNGDPKHVLFKAIRGKCVVRVFCITYPFDCSALLQSESCGVFAEA